MNRLADEKSPYLLQHASNPVHWWPWCDEAFERAAAEDKPVFLSIGYATCHWCHVMERESFEDAGVAALLNDHFISIKVDREERPDVDAAYMAVCHAMSPSCGWPLTALLTAQRKPFFVATYLPRESRMGRTGLMQLLPEVARVWRERRLDVLSSADRIVTAVSSAAQKASEGELGEETLRRGAEQLAAAFDAEHGGFGGAPKFPVPHQLLFLLRWWRRSGDERALAMVEATLRALRAGGIFDQLGYGFHRYSTDRRWLLPHFEKMLYDQALLALAYLETHQATGDQFYARAARQIFEYALRDLACPGGAFCSAEDADSEGEEGRFYVWSEEQIRYYLGADADLFIEAFGIRSGGNFAEEATGRRNGDNVLHVAVEPEELATKYGLSVGELTGRLERARLRLFHERLSRPRPLLDDKILADWNGLMIAALARGAAILGEKQYSIAAARAAGFVLEHMRTADGALLHRFREGEAGIGAFADDYAFMTWGLIELFEATGEPRWLSIAFELDAECLGLFWDEENGGLRLSAGETDLPLSGQKAIHDGALPSANSVAAQNLLRLARIGGDTRLEEKSARIFSVFAGAVRRSEASHAMLLCALDLALGGGGEVVVVGDPSAEDTSAMLAALRSAYSPGAVILLLPPDQPDHPLRTLAPFTARMEQIEGRATAYVCRAGACERPTTDARQARRLLARA